MKNEPQTTEAVQFYFRGQFEALEMLSDFVPYSKYIELRQSLNQDKEFALRRAARYQKQDEEIQKRLKT
jgi:hypothetical protein